MQYSDQDTHDILDLNHQIKSNTQCCALKRFTISCGDILMIIHNMQVAHQNSSATTCYTCDRSTMVTDNILEKNIIDPLKI